MAKASDPIPSTVSTQAVGDAVEGGGAKKKEKKKAEKDARKRDERGIERGSRTQGVAQNASRVSRVKGGSTRAGVKDFRPKPKGQQ